MKFEYSSKLTTINFFVSFYDTLKVSQILIENSIGEIYNTPMTIGSVK